MTEVCRSWPSRGKWQSFELHSAECILKGLQLNDGLHQFSIITVSLHAHDQRMLIEVISDCSLLPRTLSMASAFYSVNAKGNKCNKTPSKSQPITLAEMFEVLKHIIHKILALSCFTYTRRAIVTLVRPLLLHWAPHPYRLHLLASLRCGRGYLIPWGRSSVIGVSRFVSRDDGKDFGVPSC